MQSFEDKVAVVTGAASGIGKATATRFAEEGMKVVLADIEEQALEKAVAELKERNFDVIGLKTDVSRWDQIQQLAEATMDTYGKVNVVHNNAGVVVSGPVEELTIADWEWCLGVDLWSVIYGIKAFVPLMKSSGEEGHVVSTASTAGIQAASTIAPYNVAKFGVVAISETLRQELKTDNSPVSASVLCPGAVNTQIVTSDRNRDAESAKDHKTSPQEAGFKQNAGRLLKEDGINPADVAGMIVNAISNDEFWILTHPEWKNVLTERVRMLKETNQLYTGFGG